MARARSNHYAGPFAVSVLLHLTVLTAGLIAWPWLGKTRIVQVTPVTILTAKQIEKLSAAEQAPTPQEAQTEEPEPQAPAEVPTPKPEPAPPQPAPAPKPAPQPKVPTPQPKPVEKGPQPKAAAQPKTQARPDPGFDLDALAASLQKNQPGRPGGAARPAQKQGPSQAELDAARREAEGKARAAVNDFNSQLADQLGRAWHVNCAAESGVRIRVRVELNRDGSLNQAKLVDYVSEDAISDPVVRAAATRARAAVAASSPFRNVPPPEVFDSWKTRIVAFDGRKLCG
jgi:outer membrane biosynthesis protein TonB